MAKQIDIKKEIHRHHIIPKHRGGTDDPENLISITREEHAKIHKDLYDKYGDKRDLCAYYMLTCNMEEFRKVYCHLAGKAIQKIRKEKGLDCYGQTKEKHAKIARKGGQIMGARNAETGHMKRIQTMADCSAAGIKGSIKCRELKTNAFFDPKLRKKIASLGGKTQGRRNAESGHLQRIALLPRNRQKRKWITNGIESKVVLANIDMPKGFYNGRVQQKTNKI